MFRTFTVLCFGLLVVVACGPTGGSEPAATDPDGQSAAVYIDGFDILLMESFPLQASVVIEGQLSDGCAVLDEITAERRDNRFIIQVTASREGEVCTEALVPFRETVALDIEGLEAGEYVVEVNGERQTFELQIDNFFAEETEAQEIAISPAGIHGVTVETQGDSVVVLVSGYLNGGCSQLGEVRLTHVGDRFLIEIDQETTLNVPCTRDLPPFEETVELDMAGFDSGTYALEVNGVVESFEYQPSANTNSPRGRLQAGFAPIGSLDLALNEDKTEVRVLVAGELPDGCTTIREVTVEQTTHSTFQVTVHTQRDPSAICTMAVVPYEEWVTIETADLEAGRYQVEANEMTTEFTLD